MQGVGLPLLHDLPQIPLRRADLGVGGDLEEGEVLEVEEGPQLGEQVGLLHWRPGVPYAPAAFSVVPAPLGRDHSGQTRQGVLGLGEAHLLPRPLGRWPCLLQTVWRPPCCRS